MSSCVFSFSLSSIIYFLLPKYFKIHNQTLGKQQLHPGSFLNLSFPRVHCNPLARAHTHICIQVPPVAQGGWCAGPLISSAGINAPTANRLFGCMYVHVTARYIQTQISLSHSLTQQSSGLWVTAVSWNVDTPLSLIHVNIFVIAIYISQPTGL